MRKQLYINFKEVDLGEAKVSQNLQIHDIADMSNRNANQTYTIRLPWTDRNKIALESIYRMQSTSTLPYDKLHAKYVEDGLEVIPNGVALIQKVTEKFCDIVIGSGNYDFFSLIEGLTLQDLNMSKWDFEWDNASFMAFQTNTEGVIFPIANYGDLDPVARNVYIKNQNPMMFIHSIVTQIYEDQGWLIDGNVLSDERYLNLLLTLCNGDDESIYYDRNAIAFQKDWTDNFGTYAPGLGNYADAITASTFNIASGETWEWEIDIDLHIPSWGVGTSYLWIYSLSGFNAGPPLYVHPSGGGTYSLSLTDPSTLWSDPTTYGFFIQTKFATVKVVRGTIKGYRNGETEPSLFVRIKPHTITCPATESLSPFGTDMLTSYRDDVVVANVLPKWTQKDFLKMVFNMFCIVPQPDKFAKVLHLKQFDEIILNKAIAKDMSEKFCEDDENATEFRGHPYAKRNLLKYTVDSIDEETPVPISDSYFEVADLNLAKEKTVVTLPAAGTRNKVLLDGFDVAEILRITDGQIKEKIVPRVLSLELRDVTVGPQIDFVDDDGTTTGAINNIPFAYFYIPGKDLNLDFATLMEEYYEGIITSTEAARKLTALFKLTPFDISQLDHFIPWYVHKYSSYFYVNKISGYNGDNEMTKTELIRI